MHNFIIVTKAADNHKFAIRRDLVIRVWELRQGSKIYFTTTPLSTSALSRHINEDMEQVLAMLDNIDKNKTIGEQS